MRDRITGKNLEIKYLVATNIYEWFIFDATVFERFAQDKALVKQFNDFEEGKLSGKKTDFFYKQIAEPAITKIQDQAQLIFTHFDIRNYDAIARNAEGQDDYELIALFKLLSPEHLLKLPFANDSNRLDKSFYSELLYIIGLKETKVGNKKLIERKAEGDRSEGSMIENAINQLDSLDKISRLEKPTQFGNTNQERLFNVGLELTITWINRVLFLKLLEAQLIKYHKGDQSFSFLSLVKVQNYDDLNRLFFNVLARKQSERNAGVREFFANVPYLNSSLFEPTEIEQSTIVISNLRDESLPIFSSSVLKDSNGKKRTGKLNALEYLFEFLNAYDFSSEGSEAIQEENKTLINASVLGLIFEKINGYKDGSFFTPGFITMYMCRETIRRAVLQKFNETKDWDCQNINQLYERITDKQEANEIINSLKLCDPAVGSGHFLVSALNEIISIKSELKILRYREGRTLRDYHVEVFNDELIVTDDDGKLFEYNPKNKESQRVQETLFHEKQTIIESCLFGVDINPNSVKICRLRLWIELLKNAYYRANSNCTELETLPNIDINIKCGNSLISRFPLDADLRQALKKSEWNISSYRQAVQTYRNAENKEQKRSMERLINDIKGNLRTEIGNSDPKVKKLRKLEGDLYNLLNQMQLFEESKAEQKGRKQKKEKLEKEINQLRFSIEEIKSRKIYENAFEWRFEFPEILNGQGDFVGFDIIIGNPPYLNFKVYSAAEREIFKRDYSEIFDGKADIYYFFFTQGLRILKQNGNLAYISSRYWLEAEFAEKLRISLSNSYVTHEIIDFKNVTIFDGIGIKTSIAIFQNAKPIQGIIFNYKYTDSKKIELVKIEDFVSTVVCADDIRGKTKWILRQESELKIHRKIEADAMPLEMIAHCKQGIVTGLDKAFITTTNDFKDIPERYVKPWIKVGDIFRYSINPVEERQVIYTNEVKSLSEYPELEKRLIPYKRKLSERREAKSQKIRWFDLQWARDPALFDSQKLVCRFKASQKTFSFDDNKSYSSADTTIVVLREELVEEYDLKFILALVNSKLLDFYFKGYGKLMDYRFEYYPGPVGKLMIKKAHNQQDFVKIVDQIIHIKKSAPNADTTTLETEIDQMVYQLYGLTAEEIKLVEGESQVVEMLGE
ncbi:MAG: Eco57I restriction-modification methylase domain-containing protein [Lyngbya sp. HA4199-MV5]|nr:Eco57I restriction-modification methylase domain-containing protein [Lyngbya sp. HA4199-MV5]